MIIKTSKTRPEEQQQRENSATSSMEDRPFECTSYSETTCPSGNCQPTVEKCPTPPPNANYRSSCIAVWANDTNSGGVKMKMLSCYVAQDHPEHIANECNENECVATKAKTLGDYTTYVCCCHKANCNKEFRLELASSPKIETSTSQAPALPRSNGGGNELASSLIYAFLPVCLIALLIALAYWAYRRFRLRRILEKEGGGHKRRSIRSSLPSKSVELKDIVARGRFGCLWRAQTSDKCIVAVKVFPAIEADSWFREQEIYATPRLREHSNVLTFFGAETRGTGVDTEYWLITAYQERGSMYDFLKRNTLNITEALRLATSMLRGLAFLHGECQGGEQTYKPTIVHRDFKSKNVLIKNDMTACIADFGLAVKCIHGRPQNESDVHAQVGTRRYMAPEVLEGATEFSAIAFCQIDNYACALVLWELFTRTKLGEEPADDYYMPFEDVVGVGSKPSIDALQIVVVRERQRPKFKSLWRELPHGILICNTVEEMWDAEAEARISAGCAMERLTAVSSMITAAAQSNSSTTSSCDSGVSTTSTTSASSTSPSSSAPISSDTMPLISDYNSNLSTTTTIRTEVPRTSSSRVVEIV